MNLPEWTTLEAHAAALGDHDLRALFSADPSRADHLHLNAAGWHLDYAKHRVTEETMRLLVELAVARGWREQVDATFAGSTFRARSTSFDGATFTGKDTSFDEARFAGEYVSFRRVGFSSGQTSFGSAVFKCLRPSFDSPGEWKNVGFDWDNPPSGSQPAVPRCITPRPWPPSLVAKESGTSSSPAAPEKDDDLDG